MNVNEAVLGRYFYKKKHSLEPGIVQGSHSLVLNYWVQKFVSNFNVLF